MKLKVLILFLFANSIAFACFWDYDTIEMERQQFPSIIELLSGNFLRHSQEYYYWRIKDREEKLKQSPDSLPWLDDLAVSYAKTGNDQKAIAIALRQLKQEPNRYETLANLGTFYIHYGDLESGIRYIDKAIAVNPDAHFGREIYQRHLAEYVLSKKVKSKVSLPLASNSRKDPEALSDLKEEDNFFTFLARKYDKSSGALDQFSDFYRPILPGKHLKNAIIGIMGMMKFGNPDSPILAEAIGDLLMHSGRKGAARQLAARAYLKAAYNSKSEKAKAAYVKQAAFVLYHQYAKKEGNLLAVRDLEILYKEELQLGQKFFEEIRNDEMNWIATYQNPEEAFTKKYYKEPRLEERIQIGSRDEFDINQGYLSDSLTETTPSFKMILKSNDSSNVKAAQFVDSISKKKQAAELKKSKAKDDPKASMTSTTWVIILGVVLSIVLGVWILKRKR